MIYIDGHHLRIEDVVNVARNNFQVGISEQGRKNIAHSYSIKKSIINSGRPIYGINTGFGIFSDKRIAAKDLKKLSRNLILSHAVGTGKPLEKEIVRAAMLVRANTLSKGYSGVRLEIVETLLEMLNKDVIPVIPSQGSLGSSGDLGPLSHMALVFTTDEKDEDSDSGFAEFLGEIKTGKDAMKEAGIKRLILEAKEGLAINNGATFSAAIAALCVFDASYLFDMAEISLAMSLEAMLGCDSAYDHRIHAARGQLGQMDVANHVRQYIKGSDFINSAGRIQDAYSLKVRSSSAGSRSGYLKVC